MMNECIIDYLIEVLRCAITGEAVGDLPADIDEIEFFEFCKRHKMSNIVYKTLKNRLSKDIVAKYEAIYNKEIYIKGLQQYYLETIENSFEENKIDYLLLKGRELEVLYPSEDMRSSSDIDIYIGKDTPQRAKQIMEDIGFVVRAYSDFNDDHDEYIAGNAVLCELHRVLIQDRCSWQEECNKIPQRLLLCDDKKHRFRMTNEDFYVYNLAHTAKHMKLSGIGIRVILDQWLIYRKYKDVFDWEVLDERLKLCGLYEFEQNIRELFLYWFEKKQPQNPDKIHNMAIYIAESGWIGTYKQFIATDFAENAGKSSSKLTANLKKCINIIFSPYPSMVERYPILERKRWLTPFCRVHRAFCAIVHKRDLIRQVTGEYDGADLDYGKKLLEFKKSIGL